MICPLSKASELSVTGRGGRGVMVDREVDHALPAGGPGAGLRDLLGCRHRSPDGVQRDRVRFIGSKQECIPASLSSKLTVGLHPSGWSVARPSRHRGHLQIYAESFKGAAHLDTLMREAQATVDGAMGR